MPDLAPKMMVDLLPDDLKAYATYIVLAGVAFVAFFVLLFCLGILRLLFGGKANQASVEKNCAEDLAEYPDLKSTSGDRQLRAEGTPVRLRLVVMAPAGTASDVDIDEIPDILEKVVQGLGEICKHDKPRMKIWPTSPSYKGFGTQFHRNMLTGAEEGEQTRWVLVAGRVKVGKKQYMLGVAMQSIKLNTIGRRTIDAHEWASVLRVRVKE